MADEDTPSLLKKHDPYASLRIGEFRSFILMRFCVTMAIQIQSATVGWQIYQMTQDALSLGMIGLAEFIPFASTALFAGHVADKLNRKMIIALSLSVLLLTIFSLFYFTLESSTILQQFGTFPIYAVIFISGIARAFLWPSAFAFMSQIVPRELYPNSSTWNSTTWHISAVSGPALGGLIIGLLGMQSSYFTAVLFCSGAVICALLFRAKPISGENKEDLWKSLASGIKFVFSNQVVLGTLSLDLFAVLFGGATALLPIFAAEVLHVDSTGFGILKASPAIGAIITALLLAHRPPMKNAGVNLLLSVAGFGVCMILFALSKNFWLSFFVLALSGFFDNVSVVVRSTVIQLFTPDNMRGRVAAVNSIFIGSSNELGEVESGVAARMMGLVPSVVFGGIITLAVVGIAAKIAPKLRGLNLRDVSVGKG